MIKLLFMIERGMLTSNHTSQMQLHQHMLWANNEGMLASTFNCFFGIPSKRFRLSSTLKACIPRTCHAAGIQRRSVLLSGGSRKNLRTPRRRHGWKRNLKKNQARSWCNWWFHCTHLETTLVQRQLSRSDRRDRGMFENGGFKLRKGVRSGRFDSGMMVYWDLL